MQLPTFSSLQIHLDDQGQESLLKLARWGKILGSINFGLGIFNGLVALPLLFGGHKLATIGISSFFISGILIYMGLQLNGASKNIRFAITNENDQIFFNALEKIQKFFFLSATLYLIGFIFLIFLMSLGLIASSGHGLIEKSPTTVSI